MRRTASDIRRTIAAQVAMKTVSTTALALATLLSATYGHAQFTGGRFGGSNWGNAQPSAPSRPSYNPPPPMAPPPVIHQPPPMPSPMPMPGMPAPMPAPGMPPPPMVQQPMIVHPPAPPPPPLPRIPVPAYQRPSAWEGRVLFTPEARPVDQSERDLVNPSWSGMWTSGPANWSLGAGVFVGMFAVLSLVSVGLSRAFSRAAGFVRDVRLPEINVAMPQIGYGANQPSLIPKPGHDVSLRRVSVAFDQTVRGSLQQELKRFSATHDPSRPDALVKASWFAIDLVINAASVAKAVFAECVGAPLASAEAQFTRQADALRGRYTVETVTQARTVAMPGLTASSEEGGGFVVVTLLLAVRAPSPGVGVVASAEALVNVLRAMRPKPETLLALEVVWSPAEDGDRMSSAEMAVLYPELRPMGGAVLGRVTCGHCGSVYAAELGRCPSCGAPRG